MGRRSQARGRDGDNLMQADACRNRARDLPRITVGGRLADAAVGLAGGMMGGLGGFTGVLPTLWCTLRRYERDVQRTIIQNFNLAMLTAMNRPHELAGHLRGALRNGCTEDEIQEVLLQAAVYCGLPAALDSFRVAEKVLEEARAG